MAYLKNQFHEIPHGIFMRLELITESGKYVIIISFRNEVSRTGRNTREQVASGSHGYTSFFERRLRRDQLFCLGPWIAYINPCNIYWRGIPQALWCPLIKSGQCYYKAATFKYYLQGSDLNYKNISIFFILE